MQMDSLRDLYIEELKDLYSAEKQLVKALPKMAKKATNAQLKKAFSDHLAQTETHVERLEQVFELLGASPRGKKCRGVEGLIEEAEEFVHENPEQEVLDAGLISKAQRVEHYEIAGYGTVRTYAQHLGLDEQADLLQQTLDEEGETDQKLTQLAESAVNIEAAAAESSSTMRSDREVPRASASEAKSARSRSSDGSKRAPRGRSTARTT